MALNASVSDDAAKTVTSPLFSGNGTASTGAGVAAGVADVCAAPAAGSQLMTDWATARSGAVNAVSDIIAMRVMSRSPRIDDERITAISSLQLASQALIIDGEIIE